MTTNLDAVDVLGGISLAPYNRCRMSILIDQLPALGVGASLSLSSKPDPVALVKRAGGPGFVEYAGRVDVDAVIEEVQRVRESGAPRLVPSFVY